MTIHDDIKEVIFTEQKLRDKVRELGKELSREYKGKHPLVVCILKGGTSPRRGRYLCRRVASP